MHHLFQLIALLLSHLEVVCHVVVIQGFGLGKVEVLLFSQAEACEVRGDLDLGNHGREEVLGGCRFDLDTVA